MLHCYLLAYFYALLLTCLFLWVIICAVITVFIFMGIYCICCMYMFTIISVWIGAFTDVFVCLHFIYNASARVMCEYILIAYSSKILCGIAQLDTGYVTVCSTERTVRVLWHSVAWNGWLRMLHPHPRWIHQREAYPG